MLGGGRLRRLEIENFKSYAGKHVIDGLTGFTCVVGPNGAGKSNLMDAICFALAVQGRHLRSKKLGDLIFRKDASSAPARKAVVKVIYERSTTEIENALNNAENSDESENEEEEEEDDKKKKKKKNFKLDSTSPEIVFSRSISSSGVTSYQINSIDVTYDIYENELKKIGVLVKVRNFLVFQGDIESIAQKSPVELAKLIEDISGASELKETYEEQAKRKAEAEENILLAMQKKKMFTTQRKEVKDQKNEADLFTRKQQEFKDLKSSLVLWKIWKIKSSIESKQDEIKKVLSEIDEKVQEEKEFDDSAAKMKQNIAKLNKKFNQLDKEVKSKIKSNESFQSDKMSAEVRLSTLTARENSLKHSKAENKNKLKIAASSLVRLEEELKQLEEEERSVQSKLDGEAAEVKLTKDQMEEYLRLRQEVAALTASDKTKSEVLIQDIKTLRLRISQLEKESAGGEQETSSSSSRVEELKSRLDGLNTNLKQYNDKLKELQETRESLKLKVSKSVHESETMTSELNTINLKLSTHADDVKRSAKEVREGEAIEAMRRLFGGVHGRLANLCQPAQKKHSVAVAVAAGKHMDAIVVDSKQVAQDCIAYCKDQRIGTFLFLPLDNIRNNFNDFDDDDGGGRRNKDHGRGNDFTIPEKYRNFGPRFHLCFDLIEVAEERFRPAVLYAVGLSVVCESLEEARELCFTRGERVKAVTVQGHVIGRNGAMTGGASNINNNSANSSEGRWKQQEIDALKKRKMALEESLASLGISSSSLKADKDKLSEIEGSFHQISGQMKYAEAERNVINEKIAQLTSLLNLQSSTKESNQKEKKNLEKKLAEQEKKLSELKENISKVQQEVLSQFSQQVGISDMLEYEEKTLQQHNELFKKVKSIQTRKTDLKAHLEYENKKNSELKAADKFNEQLSQIAQEIKEAKISLKEVEDGILEQDQETEKLREELNKLKTERNKKMEELREIQNQRSVVLKEKDILKNKLSMEEIESERYRTHLHSVLRQSEIDEVLLPTVPLEDNESDEDDEENEEENESDSEQEQEEEEMDVEEDEDENEGKGKAEKGKKKSKSKEGKTKRRETVGEIKEVVKNKDKKEREKKDIKKKEEKAKRKGRWSDSLLKWRGGSTQDKEEKEEKEGDESASEKGDGRERLSRSSSSFISTSSSEVVSLSAVHSNNSENIQNSENTPAHFSQSQNKTVKRDENIIRRVDLSSIEKSKKLSEDKMNEKIIDLENAISELGNELLTMQPNMHASEQYLGVVNRLSETSLELDSLRSISREASQSFEQTKALRAKRFQECYSHVSESLALIYRDLTKSSKHPLGGNAFLSVEESSPTSSNTSSSSSSTCQWSVRFTAMPPMKRFRDMEQLSGGERTVAALALLFALHSFRQAPFFVLDEVDAALDNVNVKKICNYIKQRSQDFQCIVISLKEMFFEHADVLVGVGKDVNSHSSLALSLDLRTFSSD